MGYTGVVLLNCKLSVSTYEGVKENPFRGYVFTAVKNKANITRNGAAINNSIIACLRAFLICFTLRDDAMMYYLVLCVGFVS